MKIIIQDSIIKNNLIKRTTEEKLTICKINGMIRDILIIKLDIKIMKSNNGVDQKV